MAARGAAARGGFIPALEGMRALAAIGVMTTHVAFQTGNAVDTVPGRVFGRLDLAVALFFALSGFLLWRPHAQAARGLRPRPATARYYRSRLVRIMPAYLVLVVAVLWLLPVGGAASDSASASASTWFANLTLTQVYVPYALTAGLTQLWSLSVEMTFYLVLPLVAWLMIRLRGRRTRLRVPILIAVGVAGLFWGYVDLPVPDGVNTDTWLQGHAAWFASGMVLAEMAAAAMAATARASARATGQAAAPATPPALEHGRLRRLIARPAPMLGVAVVAYALACTDLAGPPGLVQPAPWQYACKIGLGAVIGFALLAPLTLAAPGDGRDRGAHRWLSGPVALALGRWSYALFLWHVAVLAMVFPAFGLPMFGGHMLFVWIATLVLSVLVSAASYALVEEPARRALVRWEARRAHARRRPDAGTADTPAAATPISANS